MTVVRAFSANDCAFFANDCGFSANDRAAFTGKMTVHFAKMNRAFEENDPVIFKFDRLQCAHARF